MRLAYKALNSENSMVPSLEQLKCVGMTTICSQRSFSFPLCWYWNWPVILPDRAILGNLFDVVPVKLQGLLVGLLPLLPRSGQQMCSSVAGHSLLSLILPLRELEDGAASTVFQSCKRDEVMGFRRTENQHQDLGVGSAWECDFCCCCLKMCRFTIVTLLQL